MQPLSFIYPQRYKPNIIIIPYYRWHNWKLQDYNLPRITQIVRERARTWIHMWCFDTLILYSTTNFLCNIVFPGGIGYLPQWGQERMRVCSQSTTSGFLELFKHIPKMRVSAGFKPWVDGIAYTYVCLVPGHSFNMAPLSLAAIQEQGPPIPFQIFTASRLAFLFYQSHKCILHSFKPNNNIPYRLGLTSTLLLSFCFFFFLGP